MPLTSLEFLVLCIVVAGGIPVALVILWRRASRDTRWPLSLLIAGVLAAQLAAVVAVAVHVNREHGFYPDWPSLFGAQVLAPPVEPKKSEASQRSAASNRAFLPAASGTGRYRRTILKGPKSDISQTVMTWLPPGYDDHRNAGTVFPVVMVLGGAQVHIPFVVDRIDFARTATTEIRSGRMAPFVAVFPEINVALPVETECTDYPGSTQAYTWLNQDVRNWATQTLRVSADARHWGVVGWSTGGYCAALLHLRNPERFGAAASVEGYFTPDPSGSTGNLRQLLEQNETLAQESSPQWLIEHRRPKTVHLLVMTSNSDPQSRRQGLEFLARERDVPGIQAYLVPNVGHSLSAYRAVLGPILVWLGSLTDA